jgi:hypothetical protein
MSIFLCFAANERVNRRPDAPTPQCQKIYEQGMCQLDAGPREFDHTGKLKLKFGVFVVKSNSLDLE